MIKDRRECCHFAEVFRPRSTAVGRTASRPASTVNAWPSSACSDASMTSAETRPGRDRGGAGFRPRVLQHEIDRHAVFDAAEHDRDPPVARGSRPPPRCHDSAAHGPRQNGGSGAGHSGRLAGAPISARRLLNLAALAANENCRLAAASPAPDSRIHNESSR
jgi:hypothetical protein